MNGQFLYRTSHTICAPHMKPFYCCIFEIWDINTLKGQFTPHRQTPTNSNKLVCWSLLDQCVTLLALVGVLELVELFTRLNILIDIEFGRCLLVQCEQDSYFSKDSKSNSQLEPTSLLEFVGVCLCGVNWPLESVFKIWHIIRFRGVWGVYWT